MAKPRKNVIAFKVNDDELAEIQHRAKQAEMTVSALLRLVVLRTTVQGAQVLGPNGPRASEEKNK
jgi:hypothetical protein